MLEEGHFKNLDNETIEEVKEFIYFVNIVGSGELSYFKNILNQLVDEQGVMGAIKFNILYNLITNSWDKLVIPTHLVDIVDEHGLVACNTLVYKDYKISLIDVKEVTFNITVMSVAYENINEYRDGLDPVINQLISEVRRRLLAIKTHSFSDNQVIARNIAALVSAIDSMISTRDILRGC
ncbi:hypothetical protein D3C81_08700 [compost metagenome]